MADPHLTPLPARTAYLRGIKAVSGSIFAYVLCGTYVGIGALGHDFGFTAPWVMTSTLFVWAAPAQVILISGIASGAMMLETAIAVGLSGVRLLPMVASFLPSLKGPNTRAWHLVLPAHFMSVSLWVEGNRLIAKVPRENRVVYTVGLGTGFLIAAMIGTVAGFFLAGSLPGLFVAGLLFLTPLSFLISTVGGSRMLVERIAFGMGLLLAPILAFYKVGLDLMWTGVIAGTVAYVLHRIQRRAA